MLHQVSNGDCRFTGTVESTNKRWTGSYQKETGGIDKILVFETDFARKQDALLRIKRGRGLQDGKQRIEQ